MIHVLYFARLREELNCDQEDIAMNPNLSTIEDLLTLLRSRGTPWSDSLAVSKRLMFAINQEVSPITATFSDNDEIALFPPVTGG